MVAKGVQLNYNNSSKNRWWETNPFNITLKYEGSDNDVYKFTVTMIRNTNSKRKFVLYFKLQSDILYFSDTDPDFEILQDNRFGVLDDKMSAFTDFLQCKTTDQVNYQFNTSNRLNKEFFNSLLQKMKEIQKAAEAKATSPPLVSAPVSVPPLVSAPVSASAPPSLSAPVSASAPPSLSAPVSVSPASPPPSDSASSVMDDIIRRRQNDKEKQEELNILSQDRMCSDNSYQCKLYIAQYNKYVELIDDATVKKYGEIVISSLSPQDKKDEIGKLYQARDNAINVFFEHTKKCITDGSSYQSYNDEEVLRNIVESTKALGPADDPDYFLNEIGKVNIDYHQPQMCSDNRGNLYPCSHPTGPPTIRYDQRTDGNYENWHPSVIKRSNNTGSANGAADFYGQANWQG